MDCYLSLRESSTDQIARKTLLVSDIGIEELPETLEFHKPRERLVMVLDAAQFFEADFRKGWAPWKRR